MADNMLRQQISQHILEWKVGVYENYQYLSQIKGMSNLSNSEETSLIVSRDKKGYDYVRKSILGHGTFGSVELYQRQGCLDANPFSEIFYGHNFDNSYCAIKTYKKFRLNDNGVGVEISSLREISLLLTLEHPHLLSAYEVTCDKNELRVVMEYQLELMDVYHDEHIMKDLKSKLLVCYQLLKGLNCLHKNHIFHRDLKPSNIFVGKNGAAKIGDFGFSKGFGSPNRRYTPSVCTLQYRAPELFFSTEFYSEKTDIWSMGCIFYTILTGETLFESDGSEVSAITKIFSVTGTPTNESWAEFEKLPLIYQFQPFPKKKLSKLCGLPEDLCQLIELCIMLDPKKRPSAQQLMDHPIFSQDRSFFQTGRLATKDFYEMRLNELLTKKME